MTARATHWTPLLGGEEAHSSTDGLAVQPHDYEMTPLPSVMVKESKLARSTAEHRDHDPLLNSAGERDHGQNVKG